MEIAFNTAKLAKLCNSAKKLRGEYGPRMGSLIQQRLSELAGADNLRVMKTLPGRCHELTSNFKGSLAVDLVYPDRLVFNPNHDPVPIDKDGVLSWGKVTKVIVIGIGDYH
jgi:hypothetical protein